MMTNDPIIVEVKCHRYIFNFETQTIYYSPLFKQRWKKEC